MIRCKDLICRCSSCLILVSLVSLVAASADFYGSSQLTDSLLDSYAMEVIETTEIVTNNISSPEIEVFEVSVESGIIQQEIYLSSNVIIEDEDTPLTSTLGRIAGPSGEETYYNLDMTGCVARMHDLGYSGNYWIRDDGVKMFGDYVMVAADFSTRPLGTILETSLGLGCVVDTGDFAKDNPMQIDIAVTW